jgi:hypothetical protein
MIEPCFSTQYPALFQHHGAAIYFALDEIKKAWENFNEIFHAFPSNVPDVIRTHDLPLRRRTLYPAELQRHNMDFYALAS